MTVKLLKSPQFRHEVKGSFRDLANREMQIKEWVRQGAAHRYWDSLRFCVFGTIYEMHDLHEKCYEYIGEIFYDEEEAKIVQDFSKWFDDLTIDIGSNKPDSEYLEHPEWPKVWEGAKKIYDMIEVNDKKYDINVSWEIWNMNLSEKQIKTLQQKINRENLIKQVQKEECERIEAEFKQLKDQLIAEWEIKAKRYAYPGMKKGQWPVYNTDASPEKIGHRYNVCLIIPPEQGGVNEWWNIHPSY